MTEEPSVDAIPPAIGEGVVQPRWDPREVTQLPSVDIGLPASLEPPTTTEPLTGMEAALALVDDQQRLFVVDASETWASLDYPEEPLDRYGSPAVLTVDGSRIVFSGRAALWSRELAGDEWRRIDYPAGMTLEADWGGAQLLPDDADGLWLGDPRTRRTWYVDLSDGSLTERDVDLDIATWAGERGLVRLGVSAGQRYLAVGTPEGDETVWDTDSLHSLTGPAADEESLAAVRGVGGWSGSRGPTEQNGLIALRLDDLATRAYLPITDPTYWYTDASAMSVLAWLDDHTVLASVVPQDTGGSETGTRYLFTWDVGTAELRRVSELPAALDLSLAAPAETSP